MALPKCTCGCNRGICIECIEDGFELLQAENKRLWEALDRETNSRIRYQGIVYGVLHLLDPSGCVLAVEDATETLRGRLKGGGD